MECVHCDGAGFNRAIVDLEAGMDLGAICGGCERRLYGQVLDQPIWQREDGCIFCQRSGDVALPRVECYIEHDHDTEVEFQLDDTTPLLCHAHAASLYEAVVAAGRSARQPA